MRFAITSACLLAVAALTGTIDDRTPARTPWMAGEYRVLAGDFHIHTFPLSASTIAPWDMVLEARHRGLDAIAITGHNETVSGKAARWFARLIGGPVVLAGEEVHGPHYHLIAAGIDRTVDWRLPAAAAIDEVHRQGGIAIAAHPTYQSWKWFEGPAMKALDGTEVAQPIALHPENQRWDLQEFFRRSGAAPIGSSDWHGMGPVGLCRTYLFVKDVSEAGVMEAIRAHRTVVVDRGRVYGDPELARAAGGRLRDVPPGHDAAWISGVCGVLGLACAALAASRK
jgi:predicted metal-dependent phosphoesterase TrpH